ncbi:MAG: MarR family transcriptional regulator [Streptosporangiaceae bacterium]
MLVLRCRSDLDAAEALLDPVSDIDGFLLACLVDASTGMVLASRKDHDEISLPTAAGEPLPVAGIAREMGLARQSVQRVADLLVGHGLAQYRDNPAHRRAKLLIPTAAGRDAVARIGPAHAAAARRLAATFGAEALDRAVATLGALSAALEGLSAQAAAAVQAGPV